EITKDQLWYYLVEDKPVAVLGVRDNKEITACYTEEAYQGKGAAKELFEAVKAILMARGSFTLTVKATEGSAGFFEKLGFRTVTVDDACSCCIPMVYKF
ncbi:MAG: GNAT family N-acetyltransferase, partial [Anaerovoracaceae bacterium]